MNPSSPYLHDLLDQPRALRATLASLKTQALPPLIPGQLARSAYRRVLLTGMGASFHALHPLHQALVRANVPAQMVETSDLLYSLPALLDAETLVIAVSQSGRSPEILALLDRKDARGFTLLGVTNTAGSPLDLRSDARVLTQAGEESTVSCKTYLVTLMALAWLAPALTGGDQDQALRDLEAAPPAVAQYLARWESHTAELERRMAAVRDVFVVGRGASMAAVGTGGLICKEAAHVHSEGMGSAAFRHGPLEMLSPEVFVLVYEGSGPAAELNRRLYADVLRTDSGAGLVSESAPEPVFRIPPVPEITRPIVEILPVQMMTLALSDLSGHAAGQFTHITKVTETE